LSPARGIHLNNVMGEQDLNPLGFHRHPAGRRMPSMMAPTVVMLADRRGPIDRRSVGRSSWWLGSAGSNRIRSALLQTIVGVGRPRSARNARRWRPHACYFEDGTLYAEPGIDLGSSSGRWWSSMELNLFFGGVQACCAGELRSTARVTLVVAGWP